MGGGVISKPALMAFPAANISFDPFEIVSSLTRVSGPLRTMAPKAKPALSNIGAAIA